MADDLPADLQTLTADIVSAYVANNTVSGEDLPALISSTFQALRSAASPEPATPEFPQPDKAAIKKSIASDYITSFIDGRRYKSLKRHLNTQGLSPDEYRSRYGLPKDYPMVSPSYSAQRSELARTLGLGRKPAASPEAPPALSTEPEPKASKAEAPATKAPRTRKAKAKPEEETAA